MRPQGPLQDDGLPDTMRRVGPRANPGICRNVILRRAGVCLSFALMMCACDAIAQPAERWQFRQILIDNDLFSRPFYRDSDRFYTSGVRASFGKGVHHGGDDAGLLPLWLRPMRKLCRNCEIVPNFAVGQEIYTPEDIEIAQPQPGERPWAAWLYAGFGGAIDTSDRTRHLVEFQIGVTGDTAGGEFGQKFWHNLTGSPEPLGWDNQFGPDVGLNANYQYQHIWKRSGGAADLEWDLVPHVRAAVGTMMTHAGTGVTFRVGRNITGFPNVPIRTRPQPPAVEVLQELEVFGFFGLDVRAAAYNYFLEGSLFENEPLAVDPHRYVSDLILGVTARFRRYLISYSVNRRSREFVRTVGDDSGIHVYGSLSLTVRTR